MLAWDFAPSVVIGIALWSMGYMLVIGPIRRQRRWGPAVNPAQQVAFHLGSLCLLLALVSPLDTLGDSALFSAHMTQHMVLTFAAAPLWLTGAPGWLLRRLIPSGRLGIVTHPLVAFTIFNGIMWLWHIPAVYDLALQHEPLHIFEHLSFIGSALIGWLPALRSEQEGGLSAPLRLVYLIPSMFSCTALAALITLSSIQLYAFYGNGPLRFGLTPLADQQVGGLVMWLGGDMLYLFLIGWTVKTLFDQTNTQSQQV